MCIWGSGDDHAHVGCYVHFFETSDYMPQQYPGRGSHQFYCWFGQDHCSSKQQRAVI